MEMSTSVNNFYFRCYSDPSTPAIGWNEEFFHHLVDQGFMSDSYFNENPFVRQEALINFMRRFSIQETPNQWQFNELVENLAQQGFSMNSKRELVVEEMVLDKGTYLTVHAFANKWMQEAERKYEEQWGNKDDEQLMSSWEVNEYLSEFVIKKSAQLNGRNKVVICFDRVLGGCQAISIYNDGIKIRGSTCSSNLSDRTVNILYFVTNPKNIRSPCNEGETVKVYGAGDAIMATIIKNAITNQYYGIHLDSRYSALGFYRRWGFESLTPEFVQKMGFNLESIQHQIGLRLSSENEMTHIVTREKMVEDLISNFMDEDVPCSKTQPDYRDAFAEFFFL